MQRQEVWFIDHLVEPERVGLIITHTLRALMGMGLQIENDYDKEVYNGDIGCSGDIGYIDDVDPTAREVAVSFDG